MPHIKKASSLSLISLLLLLIFALSSIHLAIAEDANKLYKWKDQNNKWHYSKLPPNQTGEKQPPLENLEVAKDAKTIIFEKKTENLINEEKRAQLTKEQQENQLKETCLNNQKDMMNTANLYRKTLDQKLQEKIITSDQYHKETLSIDRLEEIGSDINFFDYCMAGFTSKPQYKIVSECIKTSETPEKRIDCLKQLPEIE